MIKIKNTEVLGWEHAIRGMRNPMNSWEKSDSLFFDDSEGHVCDITHKRGELSFIEIGENDHTLMMNLAHGGPVHAKYRRMITVYCDITAPLYWWKEFDTYKVGTVANSCSTMHKIHEKEFTLEDFSYEHLIDSVVDEETVKSFELDMLEKYQLEGGILLAGNSDTGYLAVDYRVSENEHATEYLSPKDILEQYIIGALNANRDAFLKTHDKKYWWQMIQLLPTSYNQKRTVMLNYEVLTAMYESRKNHKLDEWRELCKWIENLPYSEIITGEREEE